MLSASFMRSSGNGQLACIALTARGNSPTCRKNWTANSCRCSRLSWPSASSSQRGWLPKVRRVSMRASRSRMKSSGARTLLIASSCTRWFENMPSGCPWRSVRPGLLVPGAIERRHASSNREELALRVHLAGDAVAQLVEQRALEILGKQHAGVAQNERRTLGELARQLPRPVEEPVLGQHLVDGSPFERLLRRELLPGQEHVSSPVASDDRGPDDVLAVARNHAAREMRQILEVGVLGGQHA